MKKILEKFITSFFVLVLGCIWYCSTRYQIKPSMYTITVYDIFGKESKINDIRINFKTKEVACSYIQEYRKRFPQYDFSVGLEMPQMEHRISLKKLFKIYR